MADKLSRYILEKYLWQAETYKKTSSVLGKNSLKNKQNTSKQSINKQKNCPKKENKEQTEITEQTGSNADEIKINDNVFEIKDFIDFMNYFNTLPQKLLKKVREEQERQKAILKEQKREIKLDDAEFVIIDDEQKVLSPQDRLKQMLEGEFKIVEDEQEEKVNIANIKSEEAKRKDIKEINFQDIEDEEYIIEDEDEDEKNAWVVVDTFKWRGEQYKLYEELTKQKVINYIYLFGKSPEEKKINQFMNKLLKTAEKEFNKQYNIIQKTKRNKAKSDRKKIKQEERGERNKLRMQKLREDLNAEKDELNFEKK